MKQTMAGDGLTFRLAEIQIFALTEKGTHPMNIYTEELLLEQRVGHLFM